MALEIVKLLKSLGVLPSGTCRLVPGLPPDSVTATIEP
jgi:hypothetical protein